MKWNELTRSETPWNWREILKKLVINPSNPKQFTQQVKQGFKNMTENTENQNTDEEVVDMDDLTADETESDESDVDDDEPTEEVEDSPEPDSKKE